MAPFAIERREPRPRDVLIDILYCGVCRQINEAYERMLRSDVRYRFVIDMGSLG